MSQLINEVDEMVLTIEHIVQVYLLKEIEMSCKISSIHFEVGYGVIPQKQFILSSSGCRIQFFDSGIPQCGAFFLERIHSSHHLNT